MRKPTKLQDTIGAPKAKNETLYSSFARAFHPPVVGATVPDRKPSVLAALNAQFIHNKFSAAKRQVTYQTVPVADDAIIIPEDKKDDSHKSSDIGDWELL